MAQVSFIRGLKIAEAREPVIMEQIKALGFTCIDHTTETQAAKPKRSRVYRDERGLIYPDFTFKDNETGKLLYVDAKSKSGPVYYFAENSWKHGNSAIPNYRERAIADNIPFIVVFEEPTVEGFVYTYGQKSSPPINIGGLLCANVLSNYHGQDHERKDKHYTKMVYYRREELSPIKDIRRVAGWE